MDYYSSPGLELAWAPMREEEAEVSYTRTKDLPKSLRTLASSKPFSFHFSNNL